MTKYFVEHITEFKYDDFVYDRANQIKLFPINNSKQNLINHVLKISDNPPVTKHLDFFNNTVGTFTINKPHNHLRIASVFEIDILKSIKNEIVYGKKECWDEINNLKKNIFYYQNFINKDDGIEKVVLRELKKINFHDHPYDLAFKICDYIYKNFKYEKGVTDIDTDIKKIWKIKSGVCQDFANTMLFLCRILNIPCRYVSGYISPKNKTFRGTGASHAWVEVCIPGNDWIGFDPTNNCLVETNHIKLCVGRDYSDCSPVKGVYKGKSKNKMTVNVSISNTKRDKFESFKTLNPEKKSLKLEENNSFINNLDVIQQQQQQQQ